MKNRRFTRFTNAFSKKAENLAYSIALDFMHHNFVRKHMTLKTTPARAIGNREPNLDDSGYRGAIASRVP